MSHFLTCSFSIEGFEKRAYIRLIPGDGSCLFSAVASCLWFVEHGVHPDFTDLVFRDRVDELRELAVSTLENINGGDFQLEGGESISRQDLLTTAATQQGLSMQGYCHYIRSPTGWGGGPEIVAISNSLKRPIFLYEVLNNVSSPYNTNKQRSDCQTSSTSSSLSCHGLTSKSVATNRVARFLHHPWSAFQNHINTGSTMNSSIILKSSGLFGWPIFADKEPLHLLFVNARFPDHRETAVSNHFNAMFLA